MERPHPASSVGTVAISLQPNAPDTMDVVSIVARGPDDEIVGRASVTRLFGSRGALTITLDTSHDDDSARPLAILSALLEATERLAHNHGVWRLELDAIATDRAAIDALITHAKQRAEPLQLSWSTTYLPVN